MNTEWILDSKEQHDRQTEWNQSEGFWTNMQQNMEWRGQEVITALMRW